MASLAIFAVIAVLAVTVVAPRARRALDALEREGADAPTYLAYRRLMRILSPLISIGTLTIVFLMVVRPG